MWDIEPAVKRQYEVYRTPAWCVQAIAPHLIAGSIVDPCAGDGAIQTAWPREARWTLCDIRPDCAPAMQVYDPRAHVGNALDWIPPESYDACVMNPPFTLALDFVQWGMLHARKVCVLLRLNWLASRKRRDFLREHTPDVYVLSKRPSFTPDGKTDGTDYAWMIWGSGLEPARVTIL